MCRLRPQTSLTSGTLLDKTRKSLKVWFRAVFEIASHRNGISAKDLQSIMETPWTWLHKLRAALVHADREPLGAQVQLDEALVRAGVNELVLVASEAGGRVRLAHVAYNDADGCKLRVDGQVATHLEVVTYGHAGYNKQSLDNRPYDAVVQTRAVRREKDAVQGCYWKISLLKRWFLSTDPAPTCPH